MPTTATEMRILGVDPEFNRQLAELVRAWRDVGAGHSVSPRCPGQPVYTIVDGVVTRIR